MKTNEYIWVIQSDEGYWNNRYGWVETIDLATKFTDKDKEIFNLPTGKNVGWVQKSIESSEIVKVTEYGGIGDHVHHVLGKDVIAYCKRCNGCAEWVEDLKTGAIQCDHLFMNIPAVPEEEQVDKDLERAKLLYEFYQMYVNVGFTEEQAFELLLKLHC